MTREEVAQGVPAVSVSWKHEGPNRRTVYLWDQNGPEHPGYLYRLPAGHYSNRVRVLWQRTFATGDAGIARIVNQLNDPLARQCLREQHPEWGLPSEEVIRGDKEP